MAGPSTGASCAARVTASMGSNGGSAASAAQATARTGRAVTAARRHDESVKLHAQQGNFKKALQLWRQLGKKGDLFKLCDDLIDYILPLGLLGRSPSLNS